MSSRMLTCFWIFALPLCSALSYQKAETQQALVDSHSKAKEVVHQLKRAEIISTVLDDFHPEAFLIANWTINSTTTLSAALGNTLDPSLLSKRPGVGLYPTNTSNVPGPSYPYNIAVALTDPDAPSRENPKWSQVCHWLAHLYVAKPTSDGIVNLHFPDSHSMHISDSDPHPKIDTLMPYKPPGPPPKTGKHRYVLLALTAANRTSEKLDLSTPGDRQRWGYGKERSGVKEWAKENGLEIIGANFFYAQNDEQ